MLSRNIFTNLLLIIALFFSAGRNASGYAINDYGATSSGNYSSAAIWSKWNGAAWISPVATPPSSADNVYILSGRTVVVNSSPSTCQDLTVEAGAKLWTANSAVNVYLYVYGFNFVCDGQIGDGNTFDGISFGIEGTSCTITGIGQFDASRIRKNLTTAITNLTIARDINLRFNTATTTMLYNACNNTNFNVTISAGATVSLIASGPNTGNVSIDGLDGTQAGLSAGGLFTVNGTLSISGKLYLTTNNTAVAQTCKWIVNGLVKVNEIVASASGTALNSLVVNSGGKIDIFGTAAWSTLSTTNNSFTFNNGSTVEYSAAGVQVVRVRSEFGGAVLNGYYDLILSGSGNKSTTLTDLWVRNNLTITGSAILDPNPTTTLIYVGGNWTNYNSAGFAEKNTFVWMNGTGLQTLTCPGGEVYYTLRYAKGGSYLLFDDNVDVINQLLYSNNGYIDLNSNTLTIRNSLTTGIQGQNASRFIVSEKTDNSSKIVWKINSNLGTYTFPFGIPPGGAANYIPVVMVKTAATSIGDVTLSTYGTPPDNLPWPTTPTNVTNLQSFIPFHNVPDNRHWTVDRFWEVSSTTPVSVDSMRFTYLSTELPDSDATPTNMGAQFWNSTYWYNVQYGVPSAYNVGVPNFNVFNTSWTITSLTSPLPIKLLSFEAIPLDKKVSLKWATASEINNDFFTLEKSLDGSEFFEIGIVDGAGNCTNVREYDFDDTKPYFGVSYYRLKQTDFDGMYSYSDIVPVSYKKSENRYSVFPNPVSENASLIINDNKRLQVIIRDTEGKLINSYFLDGSQKIYPIETAGFANGVYVVEFKSDYESQYLRLIKN